MKKIVSVLLALSLCCCSEPKNQAQQIVDDAIEAAGGDKFQNVSIDFDFRDRHYKAVRRGGVYSYERILEDTAQTLHDYLSNEGFYREINGQRAVVPDSMAAKYTRSVNSVVYFALLPYGLNDGAVNKKYLGTSTIDGHDYHKIEITFQEQGGGEDHNDIFYYWFNTETNRIDYFAYLYYTDGGGIRLRKALNPRVEGGILFQDYINYRTEPDSADAEMFKNVEELYKAGRLVELSRIELRNIEVR